MSKPGPRQYPLALVSIVLLFAIWGFAHRINEAIEPQFTAFFRLTGTKAALSQSVFTLAFFVFALPAVLFLRRFGYKLGAIFGLGSFAVGALLLYPAIQRHEYLFFFAAVSVLGAGWAWLETSANPLIVELGSPETAVRRLNFAQIFYPVGTVAGYEFGRWLTKVNLVVQSGQLTQAVVRPYVIVGLCVLFLAFLIENIEFPRVATERSGRDQSFREEARCVLSRPEFRFAVLALCATIFAHSLIWLNMAGYIGEAIPGGWNIAAPELMMLMFVVYGAGRIIGTALMFRVDPMRLLVLSGGAAAVLTAAAVATGGSFSVVCLISTNLFLSIMFPTIFATAIRYLGPLKKTASGLLVLAMGPGAILAYWVMRLADGLITLRLTFALPAAAFGIVFLYALAMRGSRSTSHDSVEHLATQR
ncbi:MAG TPA: MFS transporter [Rhizomicrobium sp.]|nr:MFS transporter [Rhizomicrobium sp.]